VQTCFREYLRLKHDAEFFAVTTEQFFDQPLLMIKNTPDLYRVLKEYCHLSFEGKPRKPFCPQSLFFNF
jgi:Mlc titration factor MtfA (ptsG expression regulator)